MRDIKNSKGKLVCRIDEKASIVEIVHKGCKTMIRFKPDGMAEVVNSEAA
jgi:hypothetical protein